MGNLGGLISEGFLSCFAKFHSETSTTSCNQVTKKLFNRFTFKKTGNLPCNVSLNAKVQRVPKAPIEPN